jgi:hypothetical protein
VPGLFVLAPEPVPALVIEADDRYPPLHKKDGSSVSDAVTLVEQGGTACGGF